MSNAFTIDEAVAYAQMSIAVPAAYAVVSKSFTAQQAKEIHAALVRIESAKLQAELLCDDKAKRENGKTYITTGVNTKATSIDVDSFLTGLPEFSRLFESVLTGETRKRRGQGDGEDFVREHTFTKTGHGVLRIVLTSPVAFDE